MTRVGNKVQTPNHPLRRVFLKRLICFIRNEGRARACSKVISSALFCAGQPNPPTPTPWPLSLLFLKGPLRQQCSPQVRLTPRRTALGNKTPESKWNSCQSWDVEPWLCVIRHSEFQFKCKPLLQKNGEIILNHFFFTAKRILRMGAHPNWKLLPRPLTSPGDVTERRRRGILIHRPRR